jgi:uncharacterized membrane protein
LLVTYFIPSDSPLAIVAFRYIFGFVFVALLPGYCLVNILFINRNRLDLIEAIVLSVALSFGLDGLVGLFLGLSPIGINFTSITVSLSVVVLALAVIAFVRMIREAPSSPIQSPAQVSS